MSVNRRTFRCDRRAAFTLVELLVVITIIAVLAGALITVSAGVWKNSQAKQTHAVIMLVQQAVDEFHKSPPAFVSTRQGDASYKARYGSFPADELEVFTRFGVPGAPSGGGANWSLAPGKVEVVPSPSGGPTYPAMTFGRSPASPSIEHRDLAAMLLTIELYSEQGRMILERIDSHYWSQGAVDPATSEPLQFLDRDDNGRFNEGDTPIRWLVDHWGTPLAYYTQRDWKGTPSDRVSTNHAAWNRASTAMVRLNGGRPVIMSYGPNGESQLAGATPTVGVLLHEDLIDDNRVNNPLNADNIYADPALAEKLSKGIEP